MSSLTTVCNITTGKIDANQAVSNGTYPFFTCASAPDRTDTFAFDDDVILIAGNNAQGNFHINRFKGKFNAYQRTYVLTIKPGYNLDFVFYALKLELGRLKERAQGSQTKFLTMPILSGINLPDYTEEEQIELASKLKCLDQEIELNNKINAELESMAKLIYDYWFVQFDFPDSNGKPYKTSGGKMDWNEDLKREIPDGWEAGTINDISKLIRGVTYNKDDIRYPTDENVVPILRATNIHGNVIDLKEMVYLPLETVNPDQKLNMYDVLITMSSGSINHIGKNGFFYFDKTAYFGAFCAKLVAKPDYSFYLYSYMQSEFITKSIKNECLGTNINNLNGTLVKGFKLVVPHKKILDDFNNQVELLFEKIGLNMNANLNLEKIRDWLLPMLMNGQVTVGDTVE